MTKIEALKASHDRVQAEAMDACAKMIEAGRAGNSLLASQYRRQYAQRSDEAGRIAAQIEELQSPQFGGIDPE